VCALFVTLGVVAAPTAQTKYPIFTPINFVIR